MISPATWDAMCARALIGIGVLLVAVIGMTAFAAGLKAGRRRRG